MVPRDLNIGFQGLALIQGQAVYQRANRLKVCLQIWDIGGQSIGGKMLSHSLQVWGPFMAFGPWIKVKIGATEENMWGLSLYM